MSNFARPITVPFAYRRREQPITLYSGSLEVVDDMRVLRGGGKIYFTWLPRPGVAFVLYEQKLFGGEGVTRLHVPELDLDASVLITSWHIHGGDMTRSTRPQPAANRSQALLGVLLLPDAPLRLASRSSRDAALVPPSSLRQSGEKSSVRPSGPGARCGPHPRS
jgi:hypothetical protein